MLTCTLEKTLRTRELLHEGSAPVNGNPPARMICPNHDELIAYRDIVSFGVFLAILLLLLLLLEDHPVITWACIPCYSTRLSSQDQVAINSASNVMSFGVFELVFSREKGIHTGDGFPFEREFSLLAACPGMPFPYCYVLEHDDEDEIVALTTYFPSPIPRWVNRQERSSFDRSPLISIRISKRFAWLSEVLTLSVR